MSQDGNRLYHEADSHMLEELNGPIRSNEDALDKRDQEEWLRIIARRIWLYNKTFLNRNDFDQELPAVRCSKLLETILWNSARALGEPPTNRGSLNHAVAAALRQNGIDAQSALRLRAFNRIRNSFMHDPDYVLSNAHVEALLHLMPREVIEKVAFASCALNLTAVYLYGALLQLTLDETWKNICARYGWASFADEIGHGIIAPEAPIPLPEVAGVLHEVRTIENGRSVSRFYGDARVAWDPFKG